MSVSLRADSGGATGALALNGSDKLLLNADGTLSATANPATGLRSQALATMQKFADEFGAVMSGVGYQKLPSGFIIQWGTVIPTTGGATVTYPIAFPNGVRSLLIVPASAVAVYLSSGGTPLVNFTAYSTATSVGTYWLAVGN